MTKLVLLFASFVAFIGSANAAVDPAITTAITDAGTDAGTVLAGVAVAIAVLMGAYWVIGALRKGKNG